ncbi:uncharacterized protein [Zea mays]|jgi:hypothetical protein|uniref:uncharacterized protein n=1 Tax=Zea mays TaxID=4577 RepID=UPI0009AAB5C8|nr:uncharacterized protein LOC109943284 [Zea mays]|eukprot:XP_020401789.1 uncharacterized protein LOC109943284 [Zea mays]
MGSTTNTNLTEAMEAQANTLATQSRLLQQICDRMEAQDNHWEVLQRSVAANANAIATLTSAVAAADPASIRADLTRELKMELSSQVEYQVTQFQSQTWERIDAVDGALSTRVEALEQVTSSLDAWRPGVDHSTRGIQTSVDALRAEISQLGYRMDRLQPPSPPLRPGILGPYASTVERQPAPTAFVDGPTGHRDAHQRREDSHGYIYTHSLLPPNGTHPAFDPYQHAVQPNWHDRFDATMHESIAPLLGQLPKVPFPTFDGDNPKLWQKRCADYFSMYSVDPRAWIRIATMHFSGAAARWLQSIEYHLNHVTWLEFGQMVADRFGKDQHEVHIRHLFHIRQSSTVSDYVERFSQLIDQLRAYNPTADPVFYIMRFLDGLKDDIKSVVTLQRPKDLDTAFVLAQLQEEVSDRRRDSRKLDNSFTSKSFSKTHFPLPLPPRASSLKHDESTPARAPQSHSTDDKLASLMAYRKAKGLCYKCGLQYTKGHRCADSVQLHVVDELWQLFQLPVNEDEGTSEELNAICLSQAAMEGVAAPKTVQFMGQLQGLELLILLDSGSSHSFLSTQVAAHVRGLILLQKPLTVQVANGAQMQCTHELADAVWSLAGCDFTSSLRVLPLQKYDLILGMDWLEKFSPMMVHWAEKWLMIPYNGSTVKLFGLQSAKGKNAVIELRQLSDLTDKDQSVYSTLPAELQALVTRFQSVFALPVGLPPVRDCDHHISLLPGAQPFHVRPYRYAPALKTEIERQVQEMLSSGIIQHSNSEFSSSVILVKKKDDSYRFCVDYRHLNALTVKTRFPVPIMDELLDELYGAAWFSTLDLRAGFHQIRMVKGN